MATKWTWGNIITGSKSTRKGQIGIYTSTTESDTKVSVTVEVWFATMYSLTDTNNTYYYDAGTTAATTSRGSVSISHSVNTGSGWSSSNRTKLGSSTYSYDRTTSAQTKYFAAKITGLDNLGSSNVSSVYTSISVPALNSFTVSYNANGGSGAPSSQTKWYGKTLTLSSTKPTRTGYSFSKWNTASGGGGTSYNPGASYTANSGATLYAQWTANTYTVTYNANGGTGAPANQTKTYGVDLTLSSTKPTRTNYNFLGWGTSASATIPTYSAGGKYTANSGITLYAIWELAYLKPRINNVSVSRCDSNWSYSDEGTYSNVVFHWETDYNATAIYIQWRLDSESSYPEGNKYEVDNIDGTIGDINVLIGNDSLDPERMYTIQITVEDSNGYNIATRTLNALNLPIDILAGGTGVAIGKPATLPNAFDIYKQTIIRGSKDVSDGSTSGQLIVGDPYGQHVAFDNNEIMAKSDANTVGNLSINYDGGNVGIGGPGSTLSLKGDRIDALTSVCIDNGCALNIKNSDGEDRSMVQLNSSDQYVFGYGGYNSNEGASYFDGNAVNIRSKGVIAITSPTAGLTARHYGVNKVLWSGGWYMTHDHTVTLSEAISAQPHGVVLVWSYYQNGGYENSNFVYIFVPKHHVSTLAGYGINCSAFSTDGNMWKYVYVSDTTIKGYSANNTNPSCGGVTITNNKYVMRYVIGV